MPKRSIGVPFYSAELANNRKAGGPQHYSMLLDCRIKLTDILISIDSYHSDYPSDICPLRACCVNNRAEIESSVLSIKGLAFSTGFSWQGP